MNDPKQKAAFVAGYAEGMRAARDGFIAALAEAGQHVMRDSLLEGLSDSRINEIADGVMLRLGKATAEDELEQRRRGA